MLLQNEKFRVYSINFELLKGTISLIFNFLSLFILMEKPSFTLIWISRCFTYICKFSSRFDQKSQLM